MHFETLRTRLIASLQARVMNGEITERGLARLTGLSQPHVHHVLKGARALSLEAADLVLERLGISLTDLLLPAECPPAPRESRPGAYSSPPNPRGRAGPRNTALRKRTFIPSR